MKPAGRLRLLVRLWRFGLVGLAATAVHLGVGIGMHQGLGVSPLRANGVAFALAVGANLLGQTRLAFPDAPADGRAVRRFLAAALAGFGLSQLIVWAVTGPLGAPYPLALAIVLASVPALSFCAMYYWAFRG